MNPMWTPESVTYGRNLGQRLLSQGLDTGPAGHWTQALARVLQAGSGAAWNQQANQGERAGKQGVADIYRQGLERGDGMNKIAAALMGNPWGADQGQKLGEQYMTTRANQGFQREQQDRQFAQQKDLVGIQHRNAMALRQDTDIVRNLRAAGIDPNSEEGRAIIRESIKGQNPVDQAVSDILKGVLPQRGAPQGPAPGMQPMSGEAQRDPMLIQTQAAVQPAPQPPGPPPIPGSMFNNMSPEQRRRTAEGLLLNPRTKPLGEQLLKDLDKGSMGTAGQNDLDKEIIAKATDVADLNTIKQQFDPKFLGLEGRATALALDWKDWIRSKSMTPEDVEFLTNYSKMATATTERLNNRIKALSGAAVSAAEEKRMYAANPTMSDSPTTFKAKLDQQIEMQRMAIARFNWLKNQYKGTPEQIAQLAQSGRIQAFPLESMKKIYNDRANEIEQQLRSQGAPAQQINDLRRRQLTQEFGI